MELTEIKMVMQYLIELSSIEDNCFEILIFWRASFASILPRLTAIRSL
jgi:hypothetical protein